MMHLGSMIQFSTMYLLIHILGVFGTKDTSHNQITQDLLDSKMYDARVRPSANSKDPINVTLGLAINMIEHLDEKRQVLTIRAEFYQTWFDYRLRWTPSKYEGLRVISVDPNLLWIPDIILQNNAQGHFGEGRKRVNALVQHDGKIVVDHPAVFKSSCEINIKTYPFDKQNCKLIFRSWAFDQKKIKLQLKSNQVDRTRHIPEGGWNLVSTSAVKGSVRTQPKEKIYDVITFSLRLKRLSLYHAMYYVIPCAMIGLMTTVVFILPVNINERMTVGLTLLIALSFFFLLMAEKSPAIADEIPIAAMYYTVTTVLSTVAYFMTCTVLRCYYSNPLQGEVPNWIRKLVFNYLAKVLYIQCSRHPLANKNSDDQRKLVSSAQSDRADHSETSFADLNEQKSKQSQLQPFMFEDERAANEVIVQNLKQQEIMDSRVAEWEEVANILNRLFILVYLFSFGISSIVVFSQSATS